MAYYSYDMLRTFQVVAVNLSMTAAASQLNQSKGSVSYQIKKLESQLVFALFKRLNARLHLTPEGKKLLQVSKVSLDQIDQEIESLNYKKTCSPYYCFTDVIPQSLAIPTPHEFYRCKT